MLNKRNILGSSIKYLRKKSGITQEDLAARLQVNDIQLDRPMISKIENQTRELLDYEILAIANVLKIDMQELYNLVKDI